MKLIKILSLLLSIVILATSINNPISDTSSDQPVKSYLVKFSNKETQSVFLDEHEAEQIFNHNNLVTVQLTETELLQVLQTEGIDYVEENRKVKLNLPAVSDEVEEIEEPGTPAESVVETSESEQTVVTPQMTDAPNFEVPVESNKVRIALLDTGIQNVGDIQVAGGASFVSSEGGFEDDNGHGTYLASLIGTQSQNEQQVEGEAELYALKVLDEHGEGTISQVIGAIEWSFDNEMDIVTFGFGTSEYSQALAETLSIAQEQGLLVIAPSGNGGQSTVDFSAQFNTVIGVGAIDEEGSRVPFSNTGSGIDLVARGSMLEGYNHEVERVIINDTAVSAILVADIASKYKWHFPTASAEAIRELLLTNAISLGDPETFGYGWAQFKLVTDEETIEEGSEEELPEEELSEENSSGEFNIQVPDQVTIPEFTGTDEEIALQTKLYLATLRDLSGGFEEMNSEDNMQSQRDRLQSQRKIQAELLALEEEYAKVTINDVIEQFGVTEVYIQSKLDEGFTLSNLFSYLWKISEENDTKEPEVLQQLSVDAVDRLINESFIAESDSLSVHELQDESLAVEEMLTVGDSVYKLDIRPYQSDMLQQVGIINHSEEQSEQLEQPNVSAGLMSTVPTDPEILEIPTEKVDEAPYRVGLYKENVSMMSGALSLSASDLTLPGRNGLSFTLQRTYDSSDSQKYNMQVNALPQIAYAFDYDAIYAEQDISYTLTRYYSVTLRKYACSGDTSTVLWSTSEADYSTIAGTYGNLGSLDAAIKARPSKSSEVVHACGSRPSEPDRQYIRSYTYKSESFTTNYGSWVVKGSVQLTAGPYATKALAGEDLGKMANGQMDTYGQDGTGDYRYRTIRRPEGTNTIYEVITNYTYTNGTKDDPLDKKFPIGKGWKWDIPYVKTENGKKYVTVNGGLYEVSGTQLKNYPWSDLSFVTDATVTYDGRTSSRALVSVFGNKQFFDANGNIIQVKDAYGNTISFGYDEVSPYGTVLTSIVDAIGNEITIAYSETEVTLRLGDKEVRYKKGMLDGKETLEQVIDPLGRVTTYSYEQKQAGFDLARSGMRNNPYYLLTKVVHPTGAETVYEYEASPVKRFSGSGRYNQAYRLALRKDVMKYTNEYAEIVSIESNKSTLVYTSDMSSSHDGDYNFSTTLFDGLLETQQTFKKDYISSTVGSVYYQIQTKVTDGQVSRITNLAYDEAKRRPNPISTSSYMESGAASTVPVTEAMTYDDYQNIVTQTNPFGLISTYVYDSATHLLKTSLQPAEEGTRSVFTEVVSRNAQGDITEMKVKENNAQGTLLQHVQNEYDTYGNLTLTRNIDVDGTSETRITYDDDYGYAFPTSVIRPYTTFYPNTNTPESKQQEIKAAYYPDTGQISSIEYVQSNNASVPDITSFEYDRLGRLKRTVNPDGSDVKLEYNDMLNEIRQTDELGRIVYSKWNAFGWKVEDGIVVEGIDKKKSKLEYDMFGRVIKVEDAEGNASVQSYDDWGRVLTTTLPDQTQTSSEYDDMNFIVSAADADGNVIRQTADRFGRTILKEQSYNGGYRSIWSGSYKADRLMMEQDGKNQLTTYTYDVLGRLASVKGADNNTYSYAYNRRGLQTTTIYPDQSVSSKKYDELGQLIRATDPKNAVESFTYDSKGNRLIFKDKKGQLFAYEYDVRNNLTKKSGPSETIEYTYNLDGTRSSMTDNDNNTTTYIYDPYMAQLSEISYPDGKTISYDYDTVGNRDHITTPFADEIDYDFVHGSQLKYVELNGVEQANYSYLNGRLDEASYANGIVSSNDYMDGKLYKLEHSLNGVDLNVYEYGYDVNHNITSRIQTVNGTKTSDAFTYDNMNRIRTSSQFNETYTYDKRGNRQTLESESNNISLDEVSYEYDEWDRLTKATQNGNTVEYRYNGDNLLVEREENGITTRYYYDGSVIIAEGIVQEDGTVVEKASYVYGNGLVVQKDANQNKAYYLKNGHGDIVELRGDSGELLNQYEYDIWGNTISVTEEVENPFRYSGEYWDESSELQYLRARWYDPSVGRFINEDTYEGDITNPLSLNLYTYTANNPLRYIDPSGHCFTEWLGKKYCQAAWDAVKKEAIAQWEFMKDVHSSWYTAVDYWTMGTLTQLDSYYRLSQENPYSLDQLLAAGMIFIEVTPQGKTAKFTDKGTEFITAAIKSCNCFTAGTKVLTDEGEKPIEEIEVGDKVLAKSDETGEVAYKEVVGLFQKQADEIYYVHIGDEIIEVTGEHPFWLDGKGWTFVKDLKVGDLLVSSDGTKLAIDKIEKEPREATVYNFEVADFHSYFVSNLGIWVHNCLVARNMNEFFGLDFGSSIKSMSQKTNTRYKGATVYKITGKTDNAYLKKGDGYYLDTLHYDHIEVVDSRGKVKAVLNLDGSFNASKTEAALKDGRSIDW